MIDEDELKRRFQELRARDAKNAPSFERLTAKRPRRVSPLIVVMPALAAAAILVVWCGTTQMQTASAPPVAARPHAPRTKAAAAALPKTRSEDGALPLDFLLETTPISVRLDADPIEGLRP